MVTGSCLNVACSLLCTKLITVHNNFLKLTSELYIHVFQHANFRQSSLHHGSAVKPTVIHVLLTLSG